MDKVGTGVYGILEWGMVGAGVYWEWIKRGQGSMGLRNGAGRGKSLWDFEMGQGGGKRLWDLGMGQGGGLGLMG